MEDRWCEANSWKKTLHLNSSGLEMSMAMVELEFFWQKNGGRRCLRWSVS